MSGYDSRCRLGLLSARCFLVDFYRALVRSVVFSRPIRAKTIELATTLNNVGSFSH